MVIHYYYMMATSWARHSTILTCPITNLLNDCMVYWQCYLLAMHAVYSYGMGAAMAVNIEYDVTHTPLLYITHTVLHLSLPGGKNTLTLGKDSLVPLPPPPTTHHSSVRSCGPSAECPSPTHPLPSLLGEIVMADCWLHHAPSQVRSAASWLPLLLSFSTHVHVVHSRMKPRFQNVPRCTEILAEMYTPPSLCSSHSSMTA